MCVCRERGKEGLIYIYNLYPHLNLPIYLEIDFKELAHVIMQVGKS